MDGRCQKHTAENKSAVNDKLPDPEDPEEDMELSNSLGLYTV